MSVRRETEALKDLVAASTLEIATHLVVYGFIVVPVVVIALPAYLGATAVGTIFVMSSSAIATGDSGWVDGLTHWFVFGAVGVVCVVFAVRLGSILFGRQHAEAKVLRPLSGEAGSELRGIAAELWRLVGQGPPPELAWFPKTVIQAHAAATGGGWQIQLSSALWDRAIRPGDTLGRAILAHEMAHIAHRDPNTFLVVSAVDNAAQLVLRLLIGSFPVLLAAIWAIQVTGFVRGTLSGELAPILTATAALIILAAVFPIVALLVVRRYLSFIFALIEVRADLVAAAATSGLTNFVEQVKADAVLRQNGLYAAADAMLSLSMTHLSDRERLTLLSSPQRLGAPKFRYFALSLVLALLLQIDLVTALIESGVFDHLVVVGLGSALSFAAIAMAVRPAHPARRNATNVLVLACGLTAVLALTHIRVDAISYVLTNFAVSIAVPGGFGGDLVDVGAYAEELRITFMDVVSQAWGAFGFGGGIIAVFANVVLFACWPALARVLPRQQSLAGPSAVAAGLAAAVATAAMSYDPWRDSYVEFWPLVLARPHLEALQQIPIGPLWIPSLAGFAAALVLRAGAGWWPRA